LNARDLGDAGAEVKSGVTRVADGCVIYDWHDDWHDVRHGRYDKIDLPPVRPVVTLVERFAGHCRCCGGVTLAPVPEGLEEGAPFQVSLLAVALYLRFVHAISYKRLVGLFAHRFGLEISEGARLGPSGANLRYQISYICRQRR
jgi:transposase